MMYKKPTWKDFKNGDTIITRWVYDSNSPESLLFVMKTSPFGGKMGSHRFYADYFFSVNELSGKVLSRSAPLMKNSELEPESTLFLYKNQNKLLYIFREPANGIDK